jgi:hypothetical protein|tara:strand:- start:19 stop:642 length:624 start_codon:yes stop_codon:yes gene_type:complete
MDSTIGMARSLLGCPRAKDAEDVDEDYKPPPKVDICDQTAVRHCIDESCASYIIEEMKLVEDQKSSNLKLKIMTFACLIALLAQFFPLNKFWFGRYLVGFCCAMYFVASGILQLVFWFVDKDIVLTTLPDPKNGDKVLRLRTNMERHKTDCLLIVETLTKEGELIGKATEKTVAIADYFNEQGEFYEAALDAVMADLVKSYLKTKKE